MSEAKSPVQLLQEADSGVNALYQALEDEHAAREATERELGDKVQVAEMGLRGCAKENDQLRAEVDHLKRHQFNASMASAMLDLRAAAQADASLLSHEAVRKTIADIERLKGELREEKEAHQRDVDYLSKQLDAARSKLPAPEPANGVDDLLWTGDNGSGTLRTSPVCSYSPLAWAYSISQEHNVAIRTAFARGQASRADTVAPAPKRYVVKIGAQTWEATVGEVDGE